MRPIGRLNLALFQPGIHDVVHRNIIQLLVLVTILQRNMELLTSLCFCGESISKNTFRWFESVYRPEMPEMHLQNFEKLQSQKIAPIRFDGLGQEKSLEISAFLVFSCLHLNQTLMMCLQVILDADFVLANLGKH